jgi:hypothetical protein
MAMGTIAFSRWIGLTRSILCPNSQNAIVVADHDYGVAETAQLGKFELDFGAVVIATAADELSLSVGDEFKSSHGINSEW